MREFWSLLLFIPCGLVFAQAVATIGPANSLASSIAAVPSGGQIVLAAGVYPITAMISRTTPITIKCSAGAVIESDIVWLSLSDKAAGSSITGCDFEPAAAYAEPCTADQVHAGTCTAIPVTINRCGGSNAIYGCPSSGDTIGYEPSINDADIWTGCRFAHCLSPEQIKFAIKYPGPGINIFVNKVTVSNNTGNRLVINFAGSDETAIGNTYVGGGAVFACLADTNFGGKQGLTGVNFSNNHIRDCNVSGIAIGNTYGAKITNNFLDHNGEAPIKIWSPFDSWGNVGFIISSNEGSYNYQGGADLEAEDPGPPPYPTTNGTITNNNFSYNGVPGNNSTGIISTGNGNMITGNTTNFNACGGLVHSGDNSNVSGNKVQHNFPNGYSDCSIQVDLPVYGKMVLTSGNRVIAGGFYGEQHGRGGTYVSIGDTVIGRTFNNGDPALMVEIGDSDAEGPRPNHGLDQILFLSPQPFFFQSK